MTNENYYKSQMEIKMEAFLDEETSDGDFGYISDEIGALMADAAFAVLKANWALNQFLERENMFKDPIK